MSAEGPTGKFIACGLLMLLCGVCSMSLLDDMKMNNFQSPLHWVLMSNIGYSLALPVYHYMFKTQQAGRLPFVHSDAMEMPKKVFLICTVLDSGAWTLTFFAMGALSAAIVQMLGGAKLIVTFLFSIKVMGKMPTSSEYMGIACTIIGLALVVIASSQHHHHGGEMGGMTGVVPSHGSGAALAFAMCFGAELTNSALYIYQEFFLKKYDAQPLQLVGTMGCFGVIVFASLLLVLNLAGVQNTVAVAVQLAASGKLLGTAVGYAACITMWNLSGIWVVKEGSAVGRAMFDVTRPALIWGVELYMHWLNFHVLHLVGFIAIVCGNLVFNGILDKAGPAEREALMKKDSPEPKSQVEVTKAI